jgi:hypothetical protein
MFFKKLLAIFVMGFSCMVVGLGVGVQLPYAYSKDKLYFISGEEVSASKMNSLVYRINELERKVAGMQKQITILHAKKVDKVQ